MPMALGVLGLSPREFGELTFVQFNDTVTGFCWKQELEAKARAQSVATIINTCGNLKKGQSVKADKLCPRRKNPPRNIYYRQLMGLPY